MSAAVVRLPSAAPRQVKNWRFKEQREAALRMRGEHADRFGHRHPWQRETERIVDWMMESPGVTAERRLLMALLHRMDPATYGEVVAEVSDTPAAIHLAKLAKPTVGLRASIEWELRRRGVS